MCAVPACKDRFSAAEEGTAALWPALIHQSYFYNNFTLLLMPAIIDIVPGDSSDPTPQNKKPAKNSLFCNKQATNKGPLQTCSTKCGDRRHHCNTKCNASHKGPIYAALWSLWATCMNKICRACLQQDGVC